MATFIELAAQMAASFETKSRDNGESFVVLKDGAPEWMAEACQAAHGDMFPDDWRYRFISEFVDYVADCGDGFDPDDGMADFADNVPVYNHEQIAWLGSHGARIDYVNAAIDEYGMSNGGVMEAIRQGIYSERYEVAVLMANFLTDMADDGDGE